MFNNRVLEKMKCLACGSDYKDQAKTWDRKLTKQHRRDFRQQQRIMKLLLLGTGESGKSTITKQMKIIHINGYSNSERIEKITDIRRNLRDAILILVGAMQNLDIPLGDDSHKRALEYIRTEAVRDDFEETDDYYDDVSSLWEDSGIQECYRRSNEFQIIDSAKYFLDKVSTLRRKDYIPTDQDVLRCRVMTNTINQIDFTAMDARTEVKFSVYDVGGQQGERRKWIQVFDIANAILFVVDCSCFDQTLREDAGKNRFLEAMENFEEIWNNRFLRGVPVLLFLNKIDLLEEKINNGRSLENLLDSIDPESRYYEILSEFRSFVKVRDCERKEFVESFPRHDPAASRTSSTSDENGGPKTSRIGRKKSSLYPTYRDDINDEVIRTAVFIKRVFMHLVQQPIKYKRQHGWHKDHSCEHYFTCAVDTHTIKKVLEGCRCFIIRKVLDQIGV